VKVAANQLWLVKSGGQVLGPHSEKAIIDSIRGRELRVIDEVCRPLGRWTYIRDEPVFAKVVEDIRLGNLHLGDDVTREVTSATSTQTLSLTDPVSLEADDMTEEISMSSVQEAMYQSYDDINRGGRDRRNISEDSFSFEKDPRIQSRVDQTTRWIVVLTGALIFLTLGYVAFNQFIARPIQSKASADVSMALAFSSIETGQYPEALEHLRLAVKAYPDDLGLATQLGILEIQVGNQLVVGRRLLERANEWSGADKKRVLTGLGLASVKSGDLDGASKFFSSALDHDPMFLAALINLGYVAIQQKNFQQANNHLQLSIKDGSRDGAEILMLVDVLSQLAASENDRTYLVEARKYIDQLVKHNLSYQPELNVAGAYLASTMGDFTRRDQHLMQFLKTRTPSQRPFRLDLFVK
jgi:tetratricopeptide (TPR) repeat protein